MSSEADSSTAKVEGEVKPVEGQLHDKQSSISSADDHRHNSSPKRESTLNCLQMSVIGRDVPGEPKVVGSMMGNTSTTAQFTLANFQFRVRKVKIELKDSSSSHASTSSSNFHGELTQPSNKDSRHNLRSVSTGDNKRNHHSETNPRLNNQVHERKVKIELKDSPCSHASTSSSNFYGEVTHPSNKDSQHNLRSVSTGDNKRNHHSETNPRSNYQVHERSRNVYPTPSSTVQVKQFSDSSRMKEFYGSKQKNEASSDGARGPRFNRTKSSANSCAEKNIVTNLIHRDQYNKSDFETNYDHAKFFMIKSYSEVDVHKSIKYNVWSSTPYGNKKLENAYCEAETIKKEKGANCPVFLFFSVNASGQFVGLAEMLGPVDFNKSLSFWQEEIWKGFLPLKWHIIKDIPNRLFQSIRLENNDNRPVTFSRDTQEIGLPQGLKMLHIFKGYQLETSLLDDFEHYESREKELRKSKISADKPCDGGSSVDDKWVWTHDPYGESVYHSLCLQLDMSLGSGKPDWRYIWTIKVPQKVKILWRLLHSRLPTKLCLVQFNLNIDSSCPMCGLLPESINHLFFECMVTKRIWSIFQIHTSYQFQFMQSWATGDATKEVHDLAYDA